MSSLDVEHRAAILLHALGEETVDAVLRQLSPEAEQRLRDKLQIVSDEPPDYDEIAEIIEEFDRVLQFALDAIEEELQHDVSVDDVRSADETARTESVLTESTFIPSEDAVADLKQLEGYQIAGGLLGESSRTIAIVVDCLDPQLASQTLRHFSDEVQSEVFALINNLGSTSPLLLARILRTTIDKGLRVKRDAFDAAEEQKEIKLAEMLRSMARKDRNQILDRLEESDRELVNRIREFLYEFRDICGIEDRSLQKLLGEVETRTLCTALCDADEEILNKVTGNLSKRARESLMEEMGLMGKVPEDEKEFARKEIVDAMQRLDQAGDLVMQ